MLVFLLLLSLFSTTEADYASHHVHHFLNHSVSPCDNFYRHVCSIDMSGDETVMTKSEHYWLDMAEELNARSLNNPVLNDITEAREDLGCEFDEANYNALLESRCSSSDFDCYFEEFLYFYKIYENSNDNVDESLKFYATYGAQTDRNVSQSAHATARMVQLLYNSSSDTLDAAVSSYERLQDRLYVLERMSHTDLKVLKEIQLQTVQLKKVLLRKFEETPWMSVTNEFGFNIRDQFTFILDQITIQTEFDEFDRDMTPTRNINRDMTSRYFEHSKRATGCKWFDVWHSFIATAIHLNNKDKTSDEEESYTRLSEGLAYNAYNNVQANVINVLAPTFWPLLRNSTTTTKLAFAGDILGHELVHSFVTDALLNRSAEFRAEAECLMDHYSRSCKLMAEGECASGVRTFTEDAADLEGVRIAYELLKKTFPARRIKVLEYPDLRITLQQSFFYSIAMRSCSDAIHDITDVHSSYDIRVNAMLSQIPEFSTAFGCKPNDALYAHKDQQCFLFGKESTGKKRGVAKKKDGKLNDFK